VCGWGEFRNQHVNVHSKLCTHVSHFCAAAAGAAHTGAKSNAPTPKFGFLVSPHAQTYYFDKKTHPPAGPEDDEHEVSSSSSSRTHCATPEQWRRLVLFAQRSSTRVRLRVLLTRVFPPPPICARLCMCICAGWRLPRQRGPRQPQAAVTQAAHTFRPAGTQRQGIEAQERRAGGDVIGGSGCAAAG
jgi:hypothetical protein